MTGTIYLVLEGEQGTLTLKGPLALLRRLLSLLREGAAWDGPSPEYQPLEEQG